MSANPSTWQKFLKGIGVSDLMVCGRARAPEARAHLHMMSSDASVLGMGD